jgi:hypothetical protein
VSDVIALGVGLSAVASALATESRKCKTGVQQAYQLAKWVCMHLRFAIVGVTGLSRSSCVRYTPKMERGNVQWYGAILPVLALFAP